MKSPLLTQSSSLFHALFLSKLFQLSYSWIGNPQVELLRISWFPKPFCLTPFEVRCNWNSFSSFSLSVEGRKLLQDIEESPDFANERFGSSLVVVIAALFFSILCVLGFYGLLRCRRLYRRRGVVSQPSLDMDVERAQTCIKKKDLEALPVTVYRTGYPLRAVDCPICLAEFMEGEKVRVLPDCCHSFHLDCIDAWLLSNASCPSCRHSLLCAFSKKPSAVSRMDVTERNESVAANGVQSFQISGDDLTMRASSSLVSVKSASDLESGNVGETRKA